MGLEQFVKSVITRIFADEYPHLKLPAVVYATVSGAKELSEAYEVTGLMITDETNDRTFRAHYTALWYEYTLRVIDRFGNADDSFPVLPGIRSKTQFKVGAVVAIGLAHGDVEPVIIGEVIL